MLGDGDIEMNETPSCPWIWLWTLQNRLVLKSVIVIYDRALIVRGTRESGNSEEGYPAQTGGGGMVRESFAEELTSKLRYDE